MFAGSDHTIERYGLQRFVKDNDTPNGASSVNCQTGNPIPISLLADQLQQQHIEKYSKT